MARPHHPKDPEAAALIERIERSRGRVGRHLVDLRRALDVPGRLKESVRRRPFLWFGGSAGIGLVASRLLRRPRKARPKRTGFGLAFAGLLTILKPFLKGVITSEIQRRLIRHADLKSSAPETRFPLSNP